MKKHYSKRKKVVIDAIDGKIINDQVALKIENVEEYIEKNGFKIIKILAILIIFSSFINNVRAYDGTYMTKLDLTILPNVYLLITLLVLSAIFIFFALKNNIFSLLVIGCIFLLFIGIILLINGYNVVLSIIVCIISILLIWLGA